MLEKTRSRSRIQKGKKEPKKRKPLNAKRKFKANDNPIKSYKPKRSRLAILDRSLSAQRERLESPTTEELAVHEILRKNGIGYEKEQIFYYSDRFIIVDIVIPGANIGIEIDGSQHLAHSEYDRGRDQYLNKSHGIKIIRFTNKEVNKKPQEVEAKIKAEIGIKP